MRCARGFKLILTASRAHAGAIAKADEEIAESGRAAQVLHAVARGFDVGRSTAAELKTTGPEIWNDCDGAIDDARGRRRSRWHHRRRALLSTLAGKATYFAQMRSRFEHDAAITLQRVRPSTTRSPQNPGHRRRPHHPEPRPLGGRQGGAGDQRVGAMALRLAAPAAVAGVEPERCRPEPPPTSSAEDEYAGKTIVVVLPDLAAASSVMFAEVPTGIIERRWRERSPPSLTELSRPPT